MTNPVKIIHVEIEITSRLKGLIQCGQVTSWFDDGTWRDLFTFFPDEISFNEDELIGLTQDEARILYYNKDIAYLQS